MGCKANKKGWFKGDYKKKAWGNWKKKWADKKCGRDERDDRKDDFDKKIIKTDCDGGFKFKKFGWSSDDGCNGTSKKAWKSWKRKDSDDGCGNKKGWKKKDFDKKCDWKKIPPIECEPEDETPELPETDGDPQPNRAPQIIEPTSNLVMIDDTAHDNMITEVNAIDLDGDSLIFKINDSTDPDSADADSFIIDSQTGEITMTGVPSINGSADGDWTYQIEVEVTDGQATDSIILDIMYLTSA